MTGKSMKTLVLSGLMRFLSRSALLGLDWLETCDGLGSIPGRGVGFLVGWTNSGHAMRLISRTGTEGLPVPSLNCDSYRRDTRKW